MQQNLFLGFLVLIVLVLLYLLPTWVAVGRQHTNRLSIFALNLLLGWTFVGWVVSLVWAFTAQRAPEPAPIAGEPRWLSGERDCPHCAERIKAAAKVCRHCGRDVVPTA